MRRLLLFLAVLLLTLHASAQTDSLPQPRYGYLSYESALVAMPEYAIFQQKMRNLRNAYEQEVKRAEDEFNQKYEAFLEGQRDFPRTILLKRQTELQQLMQHNIEFKTQGRQDLQQAETEGLKPLYVRLNETLATIARKYGLSLIINTDANACPFIEPALSINVEEETKALLNK